MAAVDSSTGARGRLEGTAAHLLYHAPLGQGKEMLVTDPAHVETADATEFLAGLPDDSVDFILTDPPYNLAGYSRGNIQMSWRSDFNNDLAEWDRPVFDPALYLEEFKRVLAPTGNIAAFTTYNLLGRWHDVFDREFDTFQYMVWHKTNPAPKLRRAGFLNSCELIVWCWNNGHTWNFTTQKDMHNFIEAPICMGKERVRQPKHPTQKPVRVLRRLIELATNSDGLVIDPFMGVGSTGVATVELSRRFAGCDIEDDYVRVAKERLNSVQTQMPFH
jgi:site-specific DNA-methyltransferase (adenine-specific)/modification methylase